ncbi:MAG: isopentenyl-diphosphate delta-isomerase [Bacteroidota bacterium]
MANFATPPVSSNLRFDNDPTAASRKQDHITLAFESQIKAAHLDSRFNYEPLLAAHPSEGSWPRQEWLGKELLAPLWVSSMTGGTEMALTINHNLALACAEFGMGMGLGSCRSLLYDDERLKDFNVRPIIGEDRLLFANLGLAQIEILLDDQEVWRIDKLVELLDVDGLIVHVNPLQEWLQPEGDRFKRPAIELIEELLAARPDLPIMVKEVGQGMGPASLRRLLQLPLLALDTAANGGTNFSKLELLRNSPEQQATYAGLSFVGHNATEMVHSINSLLQDPELNIRCERLIISGGVRDFLDGYYLTSIAQMPAIYGQASAFLRHAQGDYEDLRQYIRLQIRGLELARAFLRPRI